eukprot:403365155
MEELQLFYDENIDDPKIFFFEKLRLKLKKALHYKNNRLLNGVIVQTSQHNSKQLNSYGNINDNRLNGDLAGLNYDSNNYPYTSSQNPDFDQNELQHNAVVDPNQYEQAFGSNNTLEDFDQYNNHIVHNQLNYDQDADEFDRIQEEEEEGSEYQSNDNSYNNRMQSSNTNNQSYPQQQSQEIVFKIKLTYDEYQMYLREKSKRIGVK